MAVIKPLWIITLLGAFAVNVLTYAHFPDTISIYREEGGETAAFLARDAFFYTASGLILVINIMFNLIGRWATFLPEPLVFAPKKAIWFQNPRTRKQLYRILKEWVRGFAVLINIVLATIIGLIYSANSTTGTFHLGWLLYMAAVVSVVWLAMYVVLLNDQPEGAA